MRKFMLTVGIADVLYHLCVRSWVRKQIGVPT